MSTNYREVNRQGWIETGRYLLLWLRPAHPSMIEAAIAMPHDVARKPFVETPRIQIG